MSKQINNQISNQGIALALSCLILVLTFSFSNYSFANSEAVKENKTEVGKTKPNKSHVTKSAKANKTSKLAKQNKKNEIPEKDEKAKNLRKEMHFSDQLVNGKFQLPGDSAVEVENEKPVFNLLQIRADFKDRRAKEALRD